MKALVTGATSGIGKEFAIELSKMGYELILVSRNKVELNKLKENLNTNVETFELDLSKLDNCYKLYERYKDKNIDLIINNAGVGVYGEFIDTDIQKEIGMANLNALTPHILTKLFLKEFIKRDSGCILNVASTAAFCPGPLMGAYYSTKSYIYNLTCSIYEELENRNSKVKICVLCPGPVNTNFNTGLGIEFSTKALSSEYVVKYALKKMKKGTLVIIPGFTNKLLRLTMKFIPLRLLLRINYKIQDKKVIK